jgi:hypothetical protein
VEAGGVNVMSATQSASLAGGVTVLACWLFECWVDRGWKKSPTAGAALGAILAVLFAITLAGGQDAPATQPAEHTPQVQQ